MNTTERNGLIQRYAAGFEEVRNALGGFTPEMLTARLFEGKWSAAEIVQHLADSEMTSALRLRNLLTEDFPIIYGYDQDAYAAKMYYNERDIAPALEAFRGARATSLQLLERLNEEDWQREGWHNEHGRYTVETWLKIYAAHAHNHAQQIVRLQQAFQSKS
ncbi:MAG: DinB family protein [Pyrinomonadaceae bacterium]